MKMFVRKIFMKSAVLLLSSPVVSLTCTFSNTNQQVATPYIGQNNLQIEDVSI